MIKPCWTFVRLSGVAATVVAACLVLNQVPVRGQQTPVQIPDGVLAAAGQGELVRIIVGVRADSYRPEGDLDGPAAAAQRADVASRVDQVVGRLTAAVQRPVRRFDTIPYFATVVDLNALLQLQIDPDVTSIEEDQALRPSLAQSVPLIGAPTAWAAGFTGAGWSIAILDTGVEKTHPFLAGKVVSEACYSNAGGLAGGVTTCPGGATSSTAAGSGVNCTLGGCEHGTHVAGIAAGVNATFSGVARGASLISIQVFTRVNSAAQCAPSAAPCLMSFTSDQIAAMLRVYALRTTLNIASVNISIGGGRVFTQSSCDAINPSPKAAIDTLRSVNIATVIASGNDGYADSMGFPGCISTAVSVGSTTKTNAVSAFSNSVSFLSLLAPGSAITSSVPGGGYAVLDGTSMATPHVAGAWAIMRQQSPAATVSQVLASLRTTGVPLTDPRNGLVVPRIRLSQGLVSNPLISIDTPSAGAAVPVPFQVSGWAIDTAALSGPGVDAVHIYAYPNPGSGAAAIGLGVAGYGTARADVGAVFGSRFTNSGYNFTVNSLPPGVYRLAVFAHSTVTGVFSVQTRDITVRSTASNPLISIDTPAGGSVSVPFQVGGWAIDTGAPSGPGVDAVHIYAYPNPGSGAAAIGLGVAGYGAARADVGAAFGSRFTNSGYNFTVNSLPPGVYRLVVFAHSTLTGVFSAQTVDITVRPTASNPLISIDTPAGGSIPVPFQVGGWAIDTGAPSGPGVDAVHIYAYPNPGSGAAAVFLGVAGYGGLAPTLGRSLDRASRTRVTTSR